MGSRDLVCNIPDGSKVKYWSQTVNRWISATLLSKNDDGTYDLDLKRRAPASLIRPVPPKPKTGKRDSTKAAMPITQIVHGQDAKKKDKKRSKASKCDDVSEVVDK